MRSTPATSPSEGPAGPGDAPRAGCFEGRVIADRYRIERLIGAGGMGMVFLAEQVPLHRAVALKLLPVGRRGEDQVVRRAIREAQALAAVEHEAIVRVLDVGQAETGEMFIALEFLRGATLRELLLQYEVLPWRWALHAMDQVLGALHALHARGMVHRDVKPSNCFCLTDGSPLGSPPRIKLIDFGIAKLLEPSENDQITADGCGVGTPAYAAPEQMLAGQGGIAADIHCAGVTLYVLLTGRLPTTAPRRAAGSGLLRPPSAVNPAAGIPAELDAAVLRSLERIPEKRFPSAVSMADALRRILADGSDASTLVARSGSSLHELVQAPPAHRSEPPRVPPPSAISLLPSSDAQLARLHAKVGAFWITGVLHSSLARSILVPQLRTREEGWTSGLGTVLQTAPPTPIPSGQPILKVFEESGRSLLILGEPGTGKTTQLLLLAEALLQQGAMPVPVVFTLATWDKSARSMRAWLVDELSFQYQVPPSLACNWVSLGFVLPLLDGLDEVRQDQRSYCVAAINRVLELEELPGIVVTSRTEEYRSLPERLRMTATVRLHRLAHDAVAAVFQQHPVLTDLPTAWKDDLIQLAESPLALSLLVQLASITSPLNVSKSTRERDLHSLLDQYIDGMLARSGKKRLSFEREHLLNGLHKLAVAMQRHHCAVFQLDALQPSWLLHNYSVFLYAIASRFLAAAVFSGGLILSFGASPLENMGFRATIRFGLVLSACTALTAGLVTGVDAAVRLYGGSSPLRSKWQYRFRVAGIALVTSALNAAVVGGHEHHLAATIMGAQTGLVAALLLSPHAGIGESRSDVRPHDAPRFSVRRAIRSLPIGLPLAVLGYLLSSGEKNALASIVSAVYVLSMSLLIGGLRGREVDERVTPTAGIRRSLRSALFVALAGGAAHLSILPFMLGIRYSLYTALTTIVTLWMWYGGTMVIRHVVLRLLLRHEGHTYCEERCLEGAADRALLHRVGGGFMFIHPLFMYHFARHGGTTKDASP